MYASALPLKMPWKLRRKDLLLFPGRERLEWKSSQRWAKDGRNEGWWLRAVDSGNTPA